MLWPSVHVESLEAGSEISEGINNDSNRVDALPSQSEGQESKRRSLFVCLSGWDLKVLSTFTVGFPNQLKRSRQLRHVGNPSLRPAPDDSTVAAGKKKIIYRTQSHVPFLDEKVRLKLTQQECS